MATVKEWWNRLYKRRSKEELLVSQAETLAEKLKPPANAEAILKDASVRATETTGSKRWKAWRWLMDTHRQACDRIQVLEACLRLIKRANRLGLEGRKLQEFLKPFSELPITCPNLKKLDEEIGRSQEQWIKVRDEVLENKPPVFATHAFLKLSETSGIEIASVFIGGLILLGAILMTCFYFTAIGQFASAYWTLDDLIVQGIRASLYLFLAIAILEAIFYLVFRSKFFGSSKDVFRGHAWVLEHPVRVTVLLLAVAAALTVILGTLDGRGKLKDFLRLGPGNAELAVLVDGEILKDVYLVGTTDRTAIFLQFKAPTCFSQLNDHPKHQKWELSHLAWHVPFVCPGWHCPGQNLSKHINVLVIDRLQVLCHSKKDECAVLVSKDRAEDLAIHNRLSQLRDELGRTVEDLNNGLSEMNNQIDQHVHATSEEDWTGADDHRKCQPGNTLEEQLAEIQCHMDRHYYRIISRFEEVERNVQHELVLNRQDVSNVN